jgi:AraC-like DNA-binding protein
VAGVAFRAGGTVPFVRAPAHETSDVDVPLDALWGRRCTAALRERLLDSVSVEAKLEVIEQALREMYAQRDVHPAVTFALSTFDRASHTTSISAVTDAIGMSAKRFIERFKAQVGVTPKRYCRIRRFQQAVGRAHRGNRVDWAQVALDATYAKALQAGATSESEPEDKPYGHRNAGVIDRNGVTWWIGAPVK